MIFFKTIITYLRDKQYRNLLILTLVVLIIGTIYQHFERTGKKAHRMRRFGRHHHDEELDDNSDEN